LYLPFWHLTGSGKKRKGELQRKGYTMKARWLFVLAGFIAGVALMLILHALTCGRYLYSDTSGMTMRTDKVTGKTQWGGFDGWFTPGAPVIK